MKIDAVGVASSDLQKTVAFYEALGLEFPEYEDDTDHLEPLTPDGSARLMIDTVKMIGELIGETPRPGNHSAFAIQYAIPAEVDAAATRVQAAGFTVAS
jgi:catechol 2,3-dioxygenase-like lactoylglutathione lyase family enzyme